MEEVSLSEPESHYYADLFQRCDEERTGKITMLKATELYRAADISNEKIQEVSGRMSKEQPDALYLRIFLFHNNANA